MMSETLDKLVGAAQRGDRDALQEVVRRIQDRVHHLVMRMLVNPDDALDATQEILILVITKLSTFRGDSAFHTWVYRVATNYLLNAKKILDRDRGLNFEIFRADLENGLATAPDPSADDVIMLNELRIGCTMAMLLCLNLKQRIAYVLGDILELDHGEAAQVLGITKSNFRKRLSRGRKKVVEFSLQNCGLATADAECTCPRRLPRAMALGRVRPDHIVFAVDDAPAYGDVLAEVRHVESALKTLILQTAISHFKCPKDLSARISRIVGSTARSQPREGSDNV